MVNNTDRIDIIKAKLTAVFKPSILIIDDESGSHIGHVGAQSGAGHFALTIASAVFEDQPTIACHRLIYDALRDLMPSDIHALKIKVLRL